ncbi:hypothetical protein [Bradyrhizobium sp. ARR65]|uniref:hypothetical protein n=1 Tax=Bradyrhizobium sp. ARR65 TaxID=1040989 RepID=UPI0018DDA5B7|nr:hypothetical protein [Bradyrhizobium sp. ARR65]
MRVAEHGGDTMLPGIGIMRALYPGDDMPGPRKRRGEEVWDHPISVCAPEELAAPGLQYLLGSVLMMA